MKKPSREFLSKLIESISPSGQEGEAANLWAAEARGFADSVARDQHGNTTAVVHAAGNPRVMLAGHCDEIGFMITHIDDKGYLWIAPVGGWDPQIAQGQRVRILGKKGRVLGVLGKCPIHLMSGENRKKVVDIKEMFVDIGAKGRKEAQRMVSVGDGMVLDYGYEEEFVDCWNFDVATIGAGALRVGKDDETHLQIGLVGEEIATHRRCMRAEQEQFEDRRGVDDDHRESRSLRINAANDSFLPTGSRAAIRSTSSMPPTSQKM